MPVIIVRDSDKWPFTWHYWVRFDRYDLNLNLLINIDFATIKVEIHLSFTRLVILKEGYINIFTEVYLLKYTIINR